MDRPTRRSALFALALIPSAIAGQDPRTPEEYTELAAAAERAPLFQSEEPLSITLRTDIDFLRDERSDSIEVEGTVTFVDLDGTEAAVVDVE